MKVSQYESLFSIIKKGKRQNTLEIKWIDGWTTKGYKGYTI